MLGLLHSLGVVSRPVLSSIMCLHWREPVLVYPLVKLTWTSQWNARNYGTPRLRKRVNGNKPRVQGGLIVSDDEKQQRSARRAHESKT
ncbi:hypothetical protein BT69DRAFT_537035 [Atractiella rhizophila]|nr:hypothetical protein BT69DRAFT_537035 [Atractiella rhizophila]